LLSAAFLAAPADKPPRAFALVDMWRIFIVAA